MIISIDVVNNITITELNDADNNPVSYTAPQTVILSNFYDESEISTATSLQTAIDDNDANLFIDGFPSDSLDDINNAPVTSVNTETGDVVLDANDVGADSAGTAVNEVNLHEAEADPHSQYTTPTEAADAAPIQSVTGSGVDLTDPENPVIDLASDGFTIFAIWAEENGALSNNNRQWSFGNGSVGAVNITIPIDCEIFAMSLEAEIGGTSVSIELMQENAPVTSQLFNGISDFVTLGTPISVSAGDRIGFRTDVETGAYTDVRVSAWFRIRSSLASTSILNDLLDVSVGSITTGQILQYDGALFVPLTLDSNTVGLGNVDNTSDANKPISIATQAALDDKLEATDIANFETTTELDTRDTANRNRANHTGTQPASTISDFDTEVSNNIDVAANTAKNSYPAADASKLAGIEVGAEVNQTDAEVKTQYENNVNTNAFTDAEKTKLAGLETSKFLGEFTSLTALQTAFPSPPVGSYANVDTGAGNDVVRYIWDTDDSVYVLQLGESTQLTDAQIKTQYENNADTNAFTDSEKSKLTGIETNAKDDQNANEVPYANGASGLSATEVQGAIDEVEARVDSVESVNTSQQSEIDQNTTDNNGSVTVHSDVVDAGSGNIITDEERRIVNGTASFGSTSTIDANQVTPVTIVMTTPLDNNKPGLTIGPNGGLVIPADYAGNWAVEWKFTFDFGNRSDITGGIDINNIGTILPITVAPTYNTRNAANPAGSAVCIWVPIGSLSVGDEVILKAFRAGTQTGVVPINANETVLTLHYLGV